MKATELRIGNYAKGLFDETVSLKAIYEDGTLGWQDGKGTTYGPMKPIKLNDWWLNSFGFKKINTTWYKDEYFAITEIIMLTYSEKKFGIPSEDLFIRDVVIQYVHQLQNLYFALTGEEL